MGTGIAGLAVQVDNVRSKSRQRKDIDFWETLLQSSKSESDKIVFSALQRRTLSSHVAKSWVPLRLEFSLIFRFWILISSIYSYAWLGHEITTNNDLPQLVHEVGLIEPLTLLLSTVFLLPEFYASLLTFKIMRSRARKSFLLGEDINTFVSIESDLKTLQVVGNKRPVYFSLLLCSIATCGLSYVVSSIISFRILGGTNDAFTVTLFAIMVSFLLGMWGVIRVRGYIDLHSPEINICDFYPPHGDKEKEYVLDLKLKREFPESANILEDPTYGFRTYFRRF